MTGQSADAPTASGDDVEGGAAACADAGEERFVFAWPGKAAAGRLAALPAATILDARDVQHVEASSQLFIEGDNLDALKALLPSLRARVKVIYIDPPYNTGRDFVYADRFASHLHAYKRAGSDDVDVRALDGRFHAAWLSMMYPRLILARELLREDGAIFVSIDDHELHHLRMLMNEVFGEDCFKNCIITRRGVKSVQAQFDSIDSLMVGHEYLLMYAKSPATRFSKLMVPRTEMKPGGWNNHWRGTDRPTMRYELFGITPSHGQWRWSEARSRQALAQYQAMLTELGTRDGHVTQEQIDFWYQEQVASTGQGPDLLRLSLRGKPEHYVPPSTAMLGTDVWTDIIPNGSASLESLLGAKVFDNPKPVALIQRILSFMTDADDTVLDFFAGSCTSAQAVLEMNERDGGRRRFIMVQQAEQTPPTSPAWRGGYTSIADIGRARIRALLARRSSRCAEVTVDYRELRLRQP